MEKLGNFGKAMLRASSYQLGWFLGYTGACIKVSKLAGNIEAGKDMLKEGFKKE